MLTARYGGRRVVCTCRVSPPPIGGRGVCLEISVYGGRVESAAARTMSLAFGRIGDAAGHVQVEREEHRSFGTFDRRPTSRIDSPLR